MEKSRAYFDKYSPKEYIASYVVPDSLTSDFIDYSHFNETDLDIKGNSEILKRAIKAHIAQQLFGIDVYEIIINEDDPMLKKVIELEKSIN